MHESNISTYGMSYNINAKGMHTHLKVYFVQKKLAYEFLIFIIILGNIFRNVLY